MEKYSDEELVNLYRNGEEKAFDFLVDKYSSSIFNFVSRLAGKAEASDITQDTFVKVWKNLHRFNDKKSSFKTWIFIIAKNTITDFLRKRKPLLFSELTKEEDIGELNLPETETISVQEILKNLENKDLLNRIMEKLPPKYHEILILYYQEEMKMKEISNILSIPENTVKSIHLRAISKLRELLVVKK